MELGISIVRIIVRKWRAIEKFSKKKITLVIIIVILLVGAGFIWWYFRVERLDELPLAPLVTIPVVDERSLADVLLAVSVVKEPEISLRRYVQVEHVGNQSSQELTKMD